MSPGHIELMRMLVFCSWYGAVFAMLFTLAENVLKLASTRVQFINCYTHAALLALSGKETS